MQLASCNIEDEPDVEYYDDDGNLVATGAEAISAMAAAIDRTQEHNRRVLAAMKPHELAKLEAWLRTRKRSTPPARPRVPATSAPRPVGVMAAPRERRDSSSSRSSGQDPGDDDPSEPPRETPAEIAARRFRELDEFVARFGLDYWDREPSQAQLELGDAA